MASRTRLQIPLDPIAVPQRILAGQRLDRDGAAAACRPGLGPTVISMLFSAVFSKSE